MLAQSFQLSQESNQPIYTQPRVLVRRHPPLLQFHVPCHVAHAILAALCMAEFSIDSLMRYATPQ